MTAEDAWAIAYYRGLFADQLTKLKPELTGQMGMLAVGLSEKDVQQYLPTQSTSNDSTVVVACCNAPQSVTLSGNYHELSALEERFKAANVFVRRLKVEIAYHSPYMQTIAGQYSDALENITPKADSLSNVVMISSVTGCPIEAKQLVASYWVQNMCSPVRFVQAVEFAFPFQKSSSRRHRTKGLSIDDIVEIGPHSALQGPLRQILTQQGRAGDVSYTSMLSRGEDAHMTALRTVGELWTHGYPINLSAANRQHDSTLVKTLNDLPAYPWK